VATILIGAIFVGLILGLLGSGGSAVLVPILTYLVGHETKTSIAESMAIIVALSSISAIPFARAKCVDWRSVILFGLPAMLGTYIGAWLGGLASNAAQLTVFGLVLILAAGLMIKKAFGKQDKVSEAPSKPVSSTLNKAILITIEGTVVGVLTGFVGVGGGFLIVPALLILGKLPMRTAIGTSLVIITMKSVVGFFKYQIILDELGRSVDWTTIGIFVAVGIVGCALGQNLNSRLNQRALKQIFAVFLVLLGLFILAKEGSKIVQPNNQEQSLTTQETVAPIAELQKIRQLQTDDALKDRFIVVDVRSKAETDVSVIPGAITEATFEQTANQHEGKMVIAYCTVGVRSQAYADQLKRNGWDAWNYKGSIIDWCKNQLPLTTESGEKTNRVHTYNSQYTVPTEYEAVH